MNGKLSAWGISNRQPRVDEKRAVCTTTALSFAARLRQRDSVLDCASALALSRANPTSHGPNSGGGPPHSKTLARFL